MHVLLIHQAYTPEDEAGSTRHAELGKRLGARGYRMTVITSSVSYLTGRPVRRNTQGTERIDVRHSWALGGIHTSYGRRVAAFLTFMVSSFLTALRVRDVDVVWGTSPPILQSATALALARWRRVPFVFEVRDLWPDFAVQAGVLRHPILISAARGFERFLYRHADRLIINSPGFRDHLVHCGASPDRIVLVPNGVDLEMFHPDDRGMAVRRNLGLEHEFIALYAGAHGPANDLDTFLDAAALLEGCPEIVCMFVGDGKLKPMLMERAASMRLRNVRFVDPQPKRRMPAFLAAADCGVAILRPLPLFATTYPNKVFDYMAAGRPTVLAIDGVIRHVIEQSGGGVFSPPGNAEALAAAILAYARDRARCDGDGRRARAYAERHFDRDFHAAALADLLSSVCRRPRRPLWIKRLMDVMLVIPVLLIVSPLMAILAVMIWATMGRPVIFRQVRLGLHGQPFMPLKFRTMTEARDAQGNLLPDEDRITPLGRLLRFTSLDELPELINVLRGEMSLVGPRPLPAHYRGRYSREQWRRHDMPAGISGWAIVRGRNALTWEEKFALDLWYIDHWSPWVDLRILVMTLWVVATAKGINKPGRATTDEFLGSTPEHGEVHR